MSGGVDSSVAAHLLLRQGYQVEGMFMFNWDADDVYCTAAQDYQDARQVCEELEIPLHRADFSQQYRERVFRHFLVEYAAGRTPNPDVLCNREIKFDAFLTYAKRLGAELIATGHYARIDRQQGRVRLLRAIDASKDQSYFLHAVPRAALAQTLFPLGELHKTQVRQLAVEAGFANHAKKDSTGICFIGERDFTRFLSQYLPAQPGEMRTPAGELVGHHQGLMFYTQGQRRGLHIGGRANGSGTPWYVVGKDLANNVLLVAQGADHPWLYQRCIATEPATWITEAPAADFTCTAQVRYRQRPAPCRVQVHAKGSLTVDFEQPQWAATPGQSLVLYDGEECLGGAVIQQAMDRSNPLCQLAG